LRKNLPKAVLFKSVERFDAFQDVLEQYNLDVIFLDFNEQSWIDFDYSEIDFIIYYPSFQFTSNAPFALYHVYDNLMYIHSKYPHIKIYPEPGLIYFYNDKYRQYLFLKSRNYPTPLTYPLLSEYSLNLVEKELGFPMVLKNRYGAGGGTVFRVDNRRSLFDFYRISNFDLFNYSAMKYFIKKCFNRLFFFHLIKAKKMSYPFLTPPLLAQKYIPHEKDVKTVVGNFKVVEGHWREKAHKEMWKVNIDGGGVGVWSKIPSQVLDLSEKLARDLKASWLNIDLIPNGNSYLITEFSPVWHHYKYKEKPSFVYKADYNLEMPLEYSLNLEKIIVDSFVK
jgi:glutathione synthase/RimK-type ligase-like ATP-grasp enzyme